MFVMARRSTPVSRHATGAEPGGSRESTKPESHRTRARRAAAWDPKPAAGEGKRQDAPIFLHTAHSGRDRSHFFLKRRHRRHALLAVPSALAPLLPPAEMESARW